MWAETHGIASATWLMVWVSRLGGPSIVSGYAAAATMFGGVSVVLLLARARRSAAAVGIFALILWIRALCASRVYLGAHYLTDIAAGVLEGVAWLLLATLALGHWHVVLGSTRAARIERGDDL